MQTSAIKEFMSGRDMLVVLPSGSGKSLCYAALPYVFDILGTNWPFSIAHVVAFCVDHPLREICIECRYKTMSTTTSIRHVEQAKTYQGMYN